MITFVKKTMEEVTKKVIEVFENSEKPLKSSEIAKKTNVDSKEIAKIIKKLKTEGLIDSPKNCYYQLKK